MVKKDIATKKLVAHNDVFSDIGNVFLFLGRLVIKENALVDAPSESFYRNADGKDSKNQFRDVAKYWVDKGVRICLLGLENQSAQDQLMPIRVLSYDAAAYKYLAQSAEKGKVVPVITVVLYFGLEPWTAPTSLRECLKDFPEELKPFVSDYKMHVIDIPRLPREVIDSFQSDFYVIADHFWQLANNKDYVPSKKRLKHVEEVAELMMVLTGDDRFTDWQILEDLKKRGEANMSEYLNRVIGEGEARGEAKGRREGREEGKIENIVASVKALMETMHWNPFQAMDAMKVALGDRSAVLEALG